MAKKRVQPAAVKVDDPEIKELVTETPPVPKRRGRPKGTGGGPKGNVLSIRGSEAWRDWVGRLADHNRLKGADVIDGALVAFAKQEGFNEPAPRR